MNIPRKGTIELKAIICILATWIKHHSEYKIRRYS